MEPGLLVQGLHLASRYFKPPNKNSPTEVHTLKLPVQPQNKIASLLQCLSESFHCGDDLRYFPLCRLRRELPCPVLSTKYTCGSFIWITHHDCRALPPRRAFICQPGFISSQHRLSESILVWLSSCVWVVISEKYPLTLNTHCLSWPSFQLEALLLAQRKVSSG